MSIPILSNLLGLVTKAWQTEPARVIAVVTSAVVFAATNFGFVVQETSVTTAVTLLLTVLFSGEVIRSKVTPVPAKANTTPTTTP
jgi:hypothetical protein